MTIERLLTIRVLGARVLVKREELQERSEGGLFIIGREFPAIARVIAIGNKVREQISVGDQVTFTRYEFHKWEVAPEYAIIPIDRLELRVRELDK